MCAAGRKGSVATAWDGGSRVRAPSGAIVRPSRSRRGRSRREQAKAVELQCLCRRRPSRARTGMAPCPPPVGGRPCCRRRASGIGRRRRQIESGEISPRIKERGLKDVGPREGIALARTRAPKRVGSPRSLETGEHRGLRAVVSRCSCSSMRPRTATRQPAPWSGPRTGPHRQSALQSTE